MLTRTYNITWEDFPGNRRIISRLTEQTPFLQKGLFFDIETTGFSAEKNALYLIGCCRFTGRSWQITQWLAGNESPEEQCLVLESFLGQLTPGDLLISYNGSTFDLTFLEKKSRQLSIQENLTSFDHVDLYKDLRPLKNFLHLNDLKLKTVERFLGIFREDTYSGGALIPVFKSYARTHTHAEEETLLLHNYEDIQDLLYILPVLAYKNIFLDGQFIINGSLRIDGETPAIQWTLTGDTPLPVSLPRTSLSLAGLCSLKTPLDAVLETRDGQIFLTLPLIREELKYFYPNYQDYYYLPQEDCAIHKSVAAFVDKKFRRKATAKNCYIKKAGEFLPQPGEKISPAFKIHFDDRLNWFEYCAKQNFSEELHACLQAYLRFFVLGSF